MNKRLSQWRVRPGMLLILILAMAGRAVANAQDQEDEFESKGLAPSLLDSIERSESRNEIEIVTFSPVIVLKGNVNGQQVNVLFDTGSWPNVIGSHHKAKLRGPIETLSPANGGFEVCNSSNLKLGIHESSNTGRICLMDLTSMKDAAGTEIDAIAGIPFSIGRVVKMDFDNNKFSLQNNATGAYEIVENLRFDELGRPWVELAIGATREQFLIDTGFDGFFSVNHTIAESLKQSGLGEESGKVLVQVYSNGVESHNESLFEIKSQIIFGTEFTHIPVLVSEDPNSPNKIGLELMHHFNVTLDLKFGKLRLNRRKTNADFKKAAHLSN